MTLMWGAVAASSLLVGAVLATLRRWHMGTIGLVLAFGAGALIASVSFELAEAGVQAAGPAAVGIGLTLGAAAYFLGDRAVERSAARSGGSSSGAALTVGALLDGIPEQLVLGIGLVAGEGVSLALLVAIFMSNLPESIAATADSLDGGKTRRHLLIQWSLVTVVCALATWGGGLIADIASPALTGGIQGFAAGALLVAAGAVDEGYVRAMHDREATVSTFMGNGLAIPHGTNEAKEAIRTSAMSFIRYDEPVDWNGKEARFVIGIAGADGGHMGLLSKIAKIFSKKETIAQLEAAQTPEEILDIFGKVNS